jgi:hypothetical protein
MHNPPTDTSKITEKIVTKNDLITVGCAAPLAHRVLLPTDDRDPANITPTAAAPVRSMSRAQKLLAALGVGVAMGTMAVSGWESPGQSTSLRLDPVGRSSVTETAPVKNTSTAPAKIATAKAAVKEAQAALTLAEVDVDRADINLQTFKTDYERYQNLPTDKAVNRHRLAKARVAYNFAKTQKSHALYGFKQAQAQLNAAEIGVAHIQSQLARVLPNRARDRVKDRQM